MATRPTVARMVQICFKGAKAANLDDVAALTDGPCAALYVGGAGNIKLLTLNNDTVTLPSVPVGILYVGARQVFATGTAATGIFALYP